MEGKNIIAGYEALSRLTEDMLLAAQGGDWDRLTSLEPDCREVVDRLMIHTPGVELSDSEQQCKLDLIRRILANDARIRELAEPQLAKLLNLLRCTDTSRKLARAYEGGLEGSD